MEGEISLLILSKKYIDDSTEKNKEKFLMELDNVDSSVTMSYVLTALSKFAENIDNVDSLIFIMNSIMKKLEDYKPVDSVFDEERRTFRKL